MGLSRISWSSASGVALTALVLAACAQGVTTKRQKDPVDPNDFPGNGDDSSNGEIAPPRPPDYVNDDSGAFGVGDRPSDGTKEDAGAGRPRSGDDGGADAALPTDPTGNDAGPNLLDAQPPPALDAGPALCPTPLAAGDLAIVELMIQSTSGSGDKGEWLEVQSTRDCILSLKGLHAESPRGTGKDTLTIADDLLLPPNGIFVIANASDPSVNHDLPAPLYVWDGSPADVLKNDGDTITLTSAAGTVVEAFTYPALTLQVGRSISFPSDCAWSDRSAWERWSYSSNVYSGALDGTPNADNTDVACY